LDDLTSKTASVQAFYSASIVTVLVVIIGFLIRFFWHTALPIHSQA